MQTVLRKYLACFPVLAVVAATTPSYGGSGDFPVGEASADRAAAVDLSSEVFAERVTHYWNYRFAISDTTGYEFPEEEETEHVWRDVVLWSVVAGFVAFFVIKVFLEGDTEEPEPEKPGKEIPPTTIIIPRPVGHSP